MQLLEPRRTKRRRMRWKKYVVIAGVAVAGLAAWKGWDAGRPRYLQWKQNRALEQAKAFIEQRDAPNAQLALEVAIKTIPGNPDVMRVAADMLEQVGAPQAMRFRRAVVQLLPRSGEDAAKLVLCCLKFRDFNAARDALSSIPVDIANEPAPLRAALAYAVVTNDAPVADYILQQLKPTHPEDTDLKHAHALLLLKHPRDEIRDQARADLEALARDNPALRLQINRELAGAALLRRDHADAKTLLDAIIADPGVTLNDRLRKANLELLVNHVPFEELFAQLAPFASASAPEAVEFTNWLMVQNRAAEANQWIVTLPTNILQDPALVSARADIFAQLEDWENLNQSLEAGAWGRVPKPVLRLAMAAHTIDSPARPSLRRETWEMTLSAAGGDLGTLRILQRLAGTWQWEEESEQTLWTIARKFPDQTWAHQSLFNAYRQKKNTNGMRDVLNALRQADGTVPRYQHDWALLTLLAEPNSNWNPAKETMHKLYSNDPMSATYATGYAFALAQAGKAAEALAVVEKLAPHERDYPPRQPYLAFVYGVARKADDLERAQTLIEGVTLLPEESYLFNRAREELTRKPEKPKSPKAAEPTPAAVSS